MTLRKLLEAIKEKYPDSYESILDYEIRCDTMVDIEDDFRVYRKDKEIYFFDFQY